MPKTSGRRSKKAGLPPGSPVHIGEKKSEKVKLSLIDYDSANFEEHTFTRVESCLRFKDKPTTTWINVEGIHDVSVIASIGECFGLHPLLVEDIVNTEQRPKMEDYDDYVFIVLRMLRPSGKSVVSEQVSIILGANFVLSFQEHEGDVFDPIRTRIREGKGQSRKGGPDFLAYSLVDAIVDKYFVVLEEFGEKIERVEERLIGDHAQKTLREINKLKTELIYLRRAVWPLRDMLAGLERGGSPLIKKSTKLYLRDVYDHTIQIIDTVETYRDIVSGMLDIYLSSMSNRMNEIMKVLTVIATIFIPLTFITGWYGMNFSYMPELQWRLGYPMVLFFMLVVGISMYLYFMRKKWL